MASKSIVNCIKVNTVDNLKKLMGRKIDEVCEKWSNFHSLVKKLCQHMVS